MREGQRTAKSSIVSTAHQLAKKVSAPLTALMISLLLNADAQAERMEPSSCVSDAAQQTATWHKAAGCLRALRDAWARAAREREDVRQNVDDALRFVQVLLNGRFVASATIHRPGFAKANTQDILKFVNDNGEAFNSMGQTDVAYFLYQFFFLASAYDEKLAEFFLSRADAALGTVLTSIDKGGLSSVTPCADNPARSCRWFHSVTRRDWHSGEGGTLNQNLHAIRDMTLLLTHFPDRSAIRTDGMRDAVKEAIEQLLSRDTSSLPSLRGFAMSNLSAANDFPYYGARLSPDGAPKYYHLHDETLNCHYGDHSADLLTSIVGNSIRIHLGRMATLCDGRLDGAIEALAEDDEEAIGSTQRTCRRTRPLDSARLRRDLSTYCANGP